MDQFTSDALGEALNCMFGATIHRLQRDRAISQRGADLHDIAMIARLHASECRHGPPNLAEVNNFGGATILLGCHLLEWPEDRSHGIVDPYIDWTELPFDLRRSGF